MDKCKNASGQQAASDLNTALLVYKALVSVSADTSRPHCIQDSTGLLWQPALNKSSNTVLTAALN